MKEEDMISNEPEGMIPLRFKRYVKKNKGMFIYFLVWAILSIIVCAWMMEV